MHRQPPSAPLPQHRFLCPCPPSFPLFPTPQASSAARLADGPTRHSILSRPTHPSPQRKRALHLRTPSLQAATHSYPSLLLAPPRARPCARYYHAPDTCTRI
eukprot:4203791-Prymnesium_polylepis.1